MNDDDLDPFHPKNNDGDFDDQPPEPHLPEPSPSDSSPETTESAQTPPAPRMELPPPSSTHASRPPESVDSAQPTFRSGKSMPHSADAEKALLSSILFDANALLPECIERLQPGPFYIPAHQIIYETMVEMWDQKVAIDWVTLSDQLTKRKSLDKVGGVLGLHNILSSVHSADLASYYLDIVQEKATLRRLITTCNDCSRRSYFAEEGVSSLLDTVESEIFAITQKTSVGTVIPMARLAMEVVDEVETLIKNKGQLSGVPFGFADLDKLTTGMHGGEMLVLAARPGMGKTSFALNVVEHVALHQKLPVAVFSLEMTSKELSKRMICSHGRVDMQKVRSGQIGAQDFPNFTNAASDFSESPIYIDDSGRISILDLRARSRRMKSRYKIELIVVDYLQLVYSDSKRAQDGRQSEVAEVSAGIKALAKELNIPILVLAQLNRNPENREGGKPRLSDLRESGSIEQDADVVMLLQNKDANLSEEDKTALQGKPKVVSDYELIVAKQRNGPVDDVSLAYFRAYTRFESRMRGEQHEQAS
ncbi:MAG: replicative DNA helicase [Verrucomicrobiales bacterium]